MQNIKSLVRTDINFNRVTSEKLRNFLNTFQPFELCVPAKVYGLMLGMEPKPSQGEILRDYSDRPRYFLIDTIEPLKVFDLGTLNIRNLSIAIGHLAEMRTRENYLADTHHITLKLKPHTKPTRKTDFEVIGRDLVNNRDIAFLPHHDGNMWRVIAVHPETYVGIPMGAAVEYEVIKYILSAVQVYEALTGEQLEDVGSRK